MDVDIKGTKKRFLAINRERLRRTHQSLRWKQRDFLEILPILFHINHAMLPGYISKETPAGIPLYTPSKKGLEALKRMSKSFTYKRRAMRSYDIQSIFLMGSVGTVAQSENSDFDIWLCYEHSLSASQVNALQAKCDSIEKWGDSIGLEVHFFLMDAVEFKEGKVTELSSESSGSTQHHLLLEEFYRTSLLVAGRFPIWWLVPPQYEKRYDSFVDELLRKRFIPSTEVIDFGGLSHIPADEFFGAALWQVYKGIDSPYKSVLKILLMETYASAYPNTELLCMQYKKMVYGGIANLEQLDPYSILLNRLEQYLQQRDESSRLDLVRRCFYFKVNLPLSRAKQKKESWQYEQLWEMTQEWGWNEEHIANLDQRNDWKIHAVLEERKILVDDLTHSYLFLSNFARNNAGLSRISQKDLNILGRKLYAAFERKAGKIELVNRGVSANIFEKRLAIQQIYTKEGEETWLLFHYDETKDKRDGLRLIKRGRSAVELLCWCHFNRLINQGTVITLETINGILSVKEVHAILDALDSAYPDGRCPSSCIEDFERPPIMKGAYVFTNVGLDPLPSHSRRGTDIVSDKMDILNYSGFAFNLAISLDMIIVTSWQEIMTYRFSSMEGILEALCQYLRWILNSTADELVDINVFSFSSSHSSSIANRLQQLFQDVRETFYKNGKLVDTRYVLEIQKSCFILYSDADTFHYIGAGKKSDLFNVLAKPRTRFQPITTDRYALTKTVLPRVFPKNRSDKIQLFYEKSGSHADIYVLDHYGAMFYQRLPFHDDHALLNQYTLFFDSVLSRQSFLLQDDSVYELINNLEFCRVSRVANGKCLFERKLIKQDKLAKRYFHVQVIGNQVDQKTVFTVYCEDREFSSFDYGNNLFKEVAQYVVRRRSSGIQYPIYITDLDLAPSLLGDREIHGVQIIEYLNYKKRIEEKLNQEMNGH